MAGRRQPAILLGVMTLLIPLLALILAYQRLSDDTGVEDPNPRVTLAPSSGLPGTTVRIVGTGAPPVSTVRISVAAWKRGEDCRVSHDARLVVTTTADADGGFSATHVAERLNAGQGGFTYFAQVPWAEDPPPPSSLACFRFTGPDSDDLRIVLNPGGGPSGTQVTISGSGAAANGKVRILATVWRSGAACRTSGAPELVADVTAGVDGRFRADHQARRVAQDQAGYVYLAEYGTPQRMSNATCFHLESGRFFSETGASISGRFLEFWTSSGGVPVFGFPVTEQLEVDGRPVQYLERQRFELHPENGQPYDVLLGRLGYEAAQVRGLLETEPFKPVGAPPNGARCLYFQETGHRVCGGFRAYWESHGLDFGDDGVSLRESLALFGYPISEEFTDPTTGMVTQYFERAVMQWAPQNQPPWDILLQRLGADAPR